MTVADPIPVGTTLRERYRLDSTLGRGAWGVVYRAHDQELNRDLFVSRFLELLGVKDGKPIDAPSSRAGA